MEGDRRSGAGWKEEVRRVRWIPWNPDLFLMLLEVLSYAIQSGITLEDVQGEEEPEEEEENPEEEEADHQPEGEEEAENRAKDKKVKGEVAKEKEEKERVDDMVEEEEKGEEDTNLSWLQSQFAYILLEANMSETGNLGAPQQTSTCLDFLVANEG